MFTSTRFYTHTMASEAILEGLAPKGGLYVSERFNPSFFNLNLLSKDYYTLTRMVFSEFLNDYDEGKLLKAIQHAYDEKFQPEIVSLTHLKDCSLVNLFHGETFAFKDMALSILPSLFDMAKEKHAPNKKTIILTATSGDTGSAALSGFSRLEDTYVIVLYPKQGISKFQELQMSQFVSDHCFVFGVEGDFDDCQHIVKEIFQTVSLEHAILSSANSINIGRIIPQVVYYFYSYIRLLKDEKIKYKDKVNFIVPTGNFGNIYAGYIAKQMGLPVNKLIIASNENNALTELFHYANYRIDRKLYKTISPSMDITISSNFERFLYHMTKDPKKVNDYMTELKEKQNIYISEMNYEHSFDAYYADEEDTLNAIKRVYQANHYLIDPHTAVGYHVFTAYKRYQKDDHYNVVLSTASPYKFSDAVLKALDKEVSSSLSDNIEALKALNPSQFDTRVLGVVSSEVKTTPLPLNQALEHVKKVIGEIDAKD